MSGIIGGVGSKSGVITNTEVSRQEVRFPLRVRGGTTIVDDQAAETFTYNSGETYIVEVEISAGTNDTKSTAEEIWRINPDDTVEHLVDYTGTIAPSISTAGTLTVTCTGQRAVQGLRMYRIG